MSTPRCAMVLAAGLGERMRPLTLTRPKPLLEVGGRALIDWHLVALARAGVRDVVINLSWLGAQIEAHVADGARFGLRVAYSREPAQPLEAGGGIYQALPLLGREPFLVVNADVWTDFDVARMVALPDDCDALLVMVQNPTQHPRGDFFLDSSRSNFSRIVPQETAVRRTYAGLGVYRPELFTGCTAGRFPLLPLLHRAMAAGRLAAQRYDGLWFDIGTPQRLQELDTRLASGANG